MVLVSWTSLLLQGKARLYGTFLSTFAPYNQLITTLCHDYRYALQLFTPASVLASLAGRPGQIELDDVGELGELFFDAKTSAKMGATTDRRSWHRHSRSYGSVSSKDHTRSCTWPTPASSSGVAHGYAVAPCATQFTSRLCLRSLALPVRIPTAIEFHGRIIR